MFIYYLVSSLLLFTLGAAVGSFLNVIVYRTISGESWFKGRSKCESCRQIIRWYDNIPLLSYFLLRAKCRYCQEPIAINHPVIELLTGTLFVWWYWGGSIFFQLTGTPLSVLQPLFWLLVGIILISIAVSDALYFVIPDTAVLILTLLTIFYRFTLVSFDQMQKVDLYWAILGMAVSLVFFASLYLVTRGRGMGLGDVKLIAPLALLLGWPKVIVGIFLSFILGAIYGLYLLIMKKIKRNEVIPFGPFMIAGSVISLIFGNQLIIWYLNLL